MLGQRLGLYVSEHNHTTVVHGLMQYWRATLILASCDRYCPVTVHVICSNGPSGGSEGLCVSMRSDPSICTFCAGCRCSADHSGQAEGRRGCANPVSPGSWPAHLFHEDEQPGLHGQGPQIFGRHRPLTLEPARCKCCGTLSSHAGTPLGIRGHLTDNRFDAVGVVVRPAQFWPAPTP